MHCRRIDNPHRMEGECENLQICGSKKEGFYTVLRNNFHSCVSVLLIGTSVDLIDNIYSLLCFFIVLQT